MTDRFNLQIAAAFVALTCTACTSLPGGIPSSAASNIGVGDAEVLEVLRNVRKSYDIPAIAAALVSDRGLVRMAAVGTRKWGTNSPTTVNGVWHIGSCTKAITATLAALLVEEGKLKWTTRVAEVFPELADTFDPGFGDVNLLQLLSHGGGLPANLDYYSISQSQSLRSQRIEVVRMAFQQKPLSAPGTNYLYSNVGYIIVGAMIERVTNSDWETAVTQRVFVSLKMTSAGFGGIGTLGKMDQPWGHQAAGKSAASNGPAADLPPVLGPAGGVHCTLQDWALFIQDQLRFSWDYALGWGIGDRDWAGGKALTHSGSNGMYSAVVWIAPGKNLAVLLCTNQFADTIVPSDKAVSGIIEIAKKR